MRPWKSALYLPLMLSGCGVTGNGPVPATTSYSGWYLEHGGQGRLQLCGQSHALRVAASADLSGRATQFGLEPDTPVYVRVQGTTAGNEITVSAVQQFGSPTPIRNCGMTGVVLPAPPPQD